MAKDPAFLFYPGDWLGGTIGMTLEEKGAYMELLMMQFTRGHMTSHMIGQTVGQLWDKVQDKFTQDAQGLWYNERLDLEKEKRKKFTDSRKNNVSGKNQHTKKKPFVNGHMTSHMENRNENYYNTNKEAFEFLTSNAFDVEQWQRILTNKGWGSVSENDCKALLYHFLESQVDLDAQDRADVKSHFKRWLNKRPTEELQTLSKKIHERQ